MSTADGISGCFSGGRVLDVATGGGVLENLSETIKQSVGEAKRAEILEGVCLPQLGTHSKDKPKVITKLLLP